MQVLLLLFSWGKAGWNPPGDWKWVLVTQSCPTLGNPIDCSLLGSPVRGILHWRSLVFNPEIKHRSPALQADSLPSEPPGKSGHWGDRILLNVLSLCLTKLTFRLMLDACSVVVLPYCPHQSASSQIPLLITGISISSAKPGLRCLQAMLGSLLSFIRNLTSNRVLGKPPNQQLFCP